MTAFGLECYACTNQPGLPGGNSCERDKAENITCDTLGLLDRCITVKYTTSLGQLGSRSLELRNCSNNISCDPNSQSYGKCKNSYYLVSLRTGSRRGRWKIRRAKRAEERKNGYYLVTNGTVNRFLHYQLLISMIRRNFW